MIFKIIKCDKSSSLRRGIITISNGKIQTPVFMPVGTVGAVKSVAPWELRDLGAEIILGNTYHLFLRPGEKLIEKFGGLSEFSRWQGPILTDSGGYQVFSLGTGKNSKPQTLNSKQIQNSKSKFSKNNSTIQQFNNKSLVKITSDGVEFRSFLDGSKHFFTPEKVVDIQLSLGSDIIMPLDVCPSSTAPKEEIKKAVEMSIEWLKRSKKHLDTKFEARNSKFETNSKSDPPTGGRNSKQRPALFGIIQGGVDKELRKYCAEEMIKLELQGYAIGGLAVGESQKEMLEIVGFLDKILPKDKPRYLMGVGTPDDILKATQLGIDMFDCVLPTRMARHGTAYRRKSEIPARNALYSDAGGRISKSETKNENLFKEINLLNSKFREDENPIDKNCQCSTCRNNFSLAYLSHLVREKEILGVRLLTLHNLHLYLDLMRGIRGSI